LIQWDVVIERAVRDDGSLLFPEKLGWEVLEEKKQIMGPYLYENQYMNNIIPTELQTFKKEWFNYYETIPKNHNTFIFVDPAISQADSADFTGVVVVGVDYDKRWYVKAAKRYKITPPQIINLLFDLNQTFNPSVIGIEEVAYQKALLYFLDEEMRRRKAILPVKGIRPPTEQTKQMRILGALVARMSWGRLFLNRGLHDLETELLGFPRGKHDDLIDALASIEYIYYPPNKEDEWKVKPAPNHPKYEQWYIQNKLRGGRNEEA